MGEFLIGGVNNQVLSPCGFIKVLAAPWFVAISPGSVIPSIIDIQDTRSRGVTAGALLNLRFLHFGGFRQGGARRRRVESISSGNVVPL